MILTNPKTLFVLIVFQSLIGCNNFSSNGPLIARIQDKTILLVVSEEKIQNGLTSLLSPAGNDFSVKSVEIVEYQNRYFLKVIGFENQICMLALKESNGDLYELNDSSIPIVVCSGCDDGCEPKLAENGWYCSEGCAQCVKSSSVTDHFIFE